MVYGRLLEDNSIEYFVPYKGGIHIGNRVIITKSEKIYNKYGWYRVVDVAEDGDNYQDGNVIYHRIGAVQEETEVEDEEIPTTDGSAATE